MRVSRVFRTSLLARSGVALSVVAGSLVAMAPQAAWAQEGATGQDPTAQDQTAADPEGSTQVQSSQPEAVDRAAADQGVPEGEIVVTGTILRGAAPTGSNLITVGEDRIQSQGATTSNELLATVPQVSNLFNNVPNARLSVAANQIQVVRPNLRNLAPETSSSASTLVLFDGHRIASVGVTQNAVDPDLIPPIAIERVEVVTDGGSATYGSDAVGGVINFITRKRFDGLQVQARYGFADDYYQVDAGGIIGKDWDSGSVFAAYNYQHNDSLFGRDRDWIRQLDWLSPNLSPIGRSCAPGNVQIGQAMFALPALAAGANACDSSDDSSFIPTSTRHGAIAGLHQELADWLTVDLRAFYGERESISYSPFRGQVNVTGGALDNPATPQNEATPRQFFYSPVPGQNPTATESVFFTFAPLLGRNSARSISEFQEWGANAEFQAELTENWGLRTLFNYSRSNSEFHLQNGFNQTLLNAFGRGTTAATAINFYNPTAADLPRIQQLIDTENAGQGKDSLFNARAILDGTLFALPGGDVKLAVGYEYLHDTYQQRIAPTDQPIGAIRSVPFVPYRRRIHSAFGEVQIPIVGADNRMDFIHTLTLSGSVRYDDFSDVGSTTNPKVGVNFKPLSWLGFRGNYSTSFNAPSPVDQLGVLRNTVMRFPFNQPFVRPGDVPSATGLVAIQGSNPGLMPQEAETWSVGIDIDPPFIEGLRASANYFNVKFDNRISIPSPNPTIYLNFPGNITSVPGGVPLAQVQDFINASGAPNAPATLAQVTAGCTNPAACPNVYALIDFRQGNYGSLDIEGLDFSLSYRTSTGFGGIDAGLSGNYVLDRTSQTGEGAPVQDELEPPFATSRLQLQATLGADIGNFRAQATLNHSSGFDVLRCDPTTVPACRPSTTGLPSQTGFPQDRVGDFNTVNLFFKYDVPGESLLLRDLSFTVNVNNVFDEDPPLSREIGQNGFANGFTLGRLVQFGVQKKF